VSHVVEGGAERQDSVWNGLQSLASDAQIVAVHDGARPFFPVALMPRLIEVARQYGSAVVSTKVTDTIKEVDIENVGAASAPRQNSQGTQPTAPVGAASRRDLLSVRVSRTVDRAKLRAVQTPQVFQLDMLKRAYAHVLEKRLHVTDEAAAVEALGLPVHLVENPDPNPKITTPLDLSYAELLLKI
jgi:2-C-methyl-D-erythritol 4-phosphate cytidylyltransferase